MFTQYEFQVVQESRSGEVQVLVPRTSYKNATLLTQGFMRQFPAGAGLVFRIEPVA